MSILIKGMEMPTSCRDCRFCDGQTDTDYGVCAWCDIDGKARDPYTMKDCPLVPVPAHGRLIEKHDVFKLIQAFPEIDKLLPVEFMKALYNLPTIIPAESPKEKTDEGTMS